jgi:hypothetical protein
VNKCSLNRDKLGDGLMDACCRSLLVFVMASSRSCLPVPVAITKSYAECHSWFLELIEAMAQIFKLLWQLRLAHFPPSILLCSNFLFVSLSPIHMIK